MANKEKLLTISQASDFLNVSIGTLRNWHKQGKLIPKRTAGGQRRYPLSQLKDFQNSDLNLDSYFVRNGRLTPWVYVLIGGILTALIIFVVREIVFFSSSSSNTIPNSNQNLDKTDTATLDDRQIYALYLPETFNTETQSSSAEASKQSSRNLLFKLNKNAPLLDSDKIKNQISLDDLNIVGKNMNLGFYVPIDIVDSTNEAGIDINDELLLQPKLTQTIQSGQATIKKNNALTSVSFPFEFNKNPVVVLTPISKVQTDWYRVKSVRKNGFVIELSKPANNEMVFNWIAVED